MSSQEGTGRKRKANGPKVKGTKNTGAKKQRRWTDDEVTEVFSYLTETIEKNLVIEVSNLYSDLISNARNI